jgi:hypothetical protein
MLKFFDVSAKRAGSVFKVEDKSKTAKRKPQKKAFIVAYVFVVVCRDYFSILKNLPDNTAAYPTVTAVGTSNQR